MLNSRLQEAEASSDLDEANKATLLDLYRKSISLIEQRRSYEEANQRFTDWRENRRPNGPRNCASQLERLEVPVPVAELADSLRRKDHCPSWSRNCLAKRPTSAASLRL